MTTWKCHACDEVTDGEDMRRIPATRQDPGYILCPCGSDDFQECWECSGCHDYCIETEFEGDTTLCQSCGNPDTGDAEAAHRDRLKGYDS